MTEARNSESRIAPPWFTPESKNEMYTLLEEAIFRDLGDALRFSFRTGDALGGELEDQTVNLVREYKTDRQLLSPHAPEEPGAHDDALTMLALDILGAAVGT